MSDLNEIEDLNDYFYYDEEGYEQETITSIWDNCIVLSIESIWWLLAQSIGLNLLFGLISSIKYIPSNYKHILNGLLGLCLINTIESQFGKALILLFLSTSYIILKLSFLVYNKFKYNKYLNLSNFFKVFYITLMILCEYYILKPDVWLQIRGVIMIFVMKIISLAEDAENFELVPSFPKYFGYMFSSCNILFGPWMSFEDYLQIYKNPARKNIWWILNVVKAVVVSLSFLTISNCWSSYFIGEDSVILLRSYKDALAFRTSHYFICFLSEATVLAAGYKDKASLKDEKWRYTVSRPSTIEFPEALSIVVKNWNRPMHEFLKKNIYKSWLCHGKFAAIFATFVVSSFLHGFEAKISTVLITLGVLSYVQYIFRNLVAEALDTCVSVYPCKDCKHTYKRNHIYSRLLIFTFSILTVLHLIFVGVLMDPSTDQTGILSKWSDLYYFSIWIALFKLAVIKL